MAKFEQDGLVIETRRTSRTLTILWLGTSDFRDAHAILTPFLHSTIEPDDFKACTVDLRRLEFMNSSSVVPLMRLLSKLQERGTKTEVLMDVRVEWQRITSRAVKTFAMCNSHISIRLGESTRDALAR